MAIILILQGDQKSPGIIPLAVKDVFSTIQEVIHFILFILDVVSCFFPNLCIYLDRGIVEVPHFL